MGAGRRDEVLPRGTDAGLKPGATLKARRKSRVLVGPSSEMRAFRVSGGMKRDSSVAAATSE